MPNPFHTEIFDQPRALQRLIQACRGDYASLLRSIPAPSEPLLTGMGASFHAAWAASFHLQNLGIKATPMEATHFLYYSMPMLAACDQVIYVSQSGSSAEVAPIVDQIRCGQVFVALTNEPGSALAASAQHVLPLLVDSETTVATKTYTNTLALLWLLARLWGGEALPGALETLDQAAGILSDLLDQAEAITAFWMEAFQDAEAIIFAGHGPHAATARQAAQTLAEWAKVPALGLSAGALRHGFIEIVRPGIAVALFGASGRTRVVTSQLAEELRRLGARLLVVENGRTSGCLPANPLPSPLDEFLSPMLDVIPAQLFTEALARQRGVQPGFRYLQKVVDKL